VPHLHRHQSLIICSDGADGMIASPLTPSPSAVINAWISSVLLYNLASSVFFRY